MSPLPIDPTRRALLGSGLGLFALALAGRAAAKPGATATAVVIARFSDAAAPLGHETVAKVVLSEAQWRAKLSPLAYTVTRRDGTERPFTGEHWNRHERGVYRCVCCGTALFDSRTKFESGTGWPSFYKPLSKLNVAEHVDRTLGMVRTAVECARCDAHLGHVFDDGPRPTGLRYCMNSVALTFHAAPKAPAKPRG
jgi:peptide-methionine (R)-S-oxide reductase